MRPAVFRDGRRQTWCGALAQLGEHLLCKQGVIGSIPIGSTSFRIIISPEMKTTVLLTRLSGLIGGYAAFGRFFDIVNGFFNRCRGAWYRSFRQKWMGADIVRYYRCVIWLRLSSALLLQVSSMVVVGCRHASGKRLNIQACC
jgi:hypothetical protein